MTFIEIVPPIPIHQVYNSLFRWCYMYTKTLSLVLQTTTSLVSNGRDDDCFLNYSLPLSKCTATISPLPYLVNIYLSYIWSKLLKYHPQVSMQHSIMCSIVHGAAH